MRLLSRGRVGAVLAVVVVAVAACGSGDDDATAERFPTRTAEAGAVTVEITPTRIDGTGAAFKVSFDTHSVELDLDVAGNARLVVGGTPWTSAVWDGAGPGGHHREGTLSFDAAGDPSGTAKISVGGLAEPVEASWTLEGN